MTGLVADDDPVSCPSCATRYHADCWTENHGCATYGCPEVPPTEGLRSLEVAPSYWGQEQKACPSCGTSILAAAVRCRTCGATFQTARPEASTEFQRRQDLGRRRPGLKRTVVVLFVLAVLPCTAVVGGVAGAVWYSLHKDDLRALPALYPALARLGFLIGLGQTVLALAAAGLYVAMGK
jgi:RING finger family protein